MKIITSFLLFVFFSCVSFSQVYWPGGSICYAESGGYNMKFEENFDGNSLDLNTWQTYLKCNENIPEGECYWARTHCVENSPCSEVQLFIDENISVGNGNLTIDIKNEPNTIFNYIDGNGDPQSASFDYTSGMIQSEEKFTGYGKYEIICDMPSGGAYWPNFWMFGWSTELDVSEFTSGTTDYNVGVHNWESGSSIDPFLDRVGMNEDLTTGFHTYTVEYDPFRVKFFLDDVLMTVFGRFRTLEGDTITECGYLEPQMLLENYAFPKAGNPLSIIVDVSLWNWVSPSNFNQDQLIVDRIRYYERDYLCSQYSVETNRIKFDPNNPVKTYQWPKNFRRIIVEDGATLEFKNNTFAFDFDGAIELEAGAKLILDNATLTSCNTSLPWNGIKAHPGSEISSTNSTIEHATIAIDARITNGSTDNEPTIDLGVQTNISDCETGVWMSNGNFSSSTFGGTTFTDNNFGFTLENTLGLNIQAANFFHHWAAIWAIDSHFSLTDGNHLEDNLVSVQLSGTFPLSTGATIGEEASTSNTFKNNLQNILSSGSDYFLPVNVKNNTFDNVTTSYTGQLTSNFFYGANDVDFVNNNVENMGRGITLWKTGDDFNKVNCNNFDEVTDKSINIIRDNSESTFLENSFTESTNNQTQNITLHNATVAPNIGEESEAAGNCFAASGSFDIDIVTTNDNNVSPENFTYFYFDDQATTDCQFPMNTGSFFKDETGITFGNCEVVGIFNLVDPAGGSGTDVLDPNFEPHSVCNDCIRDSIDAWVDSLVTQGGDDPHTYVDEEISPATPTRQLYEETLDQWITYCAYIAYLQEDLSFAETILDPLKKWRWQKRLYGIKLLLRDIDGAEQTLLTMPHNNENETVFKAVQAINLKRKRGYAGPITPNDIAYIRSAVDAQASSSGYANGLHEVLTGTRIDFVEPEGSYNSIPRSQDIVKDKVVIYPVPFSNHLNITSDKKLITKVNIVSLDDKIVKQINVNSRYHSINLESLRAGIYIVKILCDDGQTISKKTVKL